MAVSEQFSGSGAIPAFFARLRDRAAGVVKALQAARMVSVLGEMSDSQLAGIGITRSDIPRYAAYLIADDDGATFQSIQSTGPV